MDSLLTSHHSRRTATGTLLSAISAGFEMRAFLGSNFTLAGLLTTGGAAIFPGDVLLDSGAKEFATADSIASGENSSRLVSIWWPVSFAMAIAYFVFTSRRYVGKSRRKAGFYIGLEFCGTSPKENLNDHTNRASNSGQAG